MTQAFSAKCIFLELYGILLLTFESIILRLILHPSFHSLVGIKKVGQKLMLFLFFGFCQTMKALRSSVNAMIFYLHSVKVQTDGKIQMKVKRKSSIFIYKNLYFVLFKE